MLHRLEDAGLVASREVIVGEERRLYRATVAGKEAFAACRAAVKELADEVLGAATTQATGRVAGR
jgi:DNA-binding PadR family transcriptional regulator